MPETHLRLPEFTYSAFSQAFSHLQKNKKRMQKIKKQEIQDLFIKIS